MHDPVSDGSAWLQGDFTDDGRLVMLGSTLFIWSNLPDTADTPPDLIVDRFDFDGGDGSDIVAVGDRLYISGANGNRVLAYRTLPDDPGDGPDFVIGSPDLTTNTLLTNFIISNPVPVTDGQSLFVSSDFDRRLNVWTEIPDESGAHPDYVYELPEPP